MKHVVRVFGVVFVLATFGFVLDAWRGLGHGPSGERLDRMKRSPQWLGGAFENPQPLWNDVAGFFPRMLHPSHYTTPSEAVPTERVDPALFKSAPESGVRITWFGHSSTLIELDGARLLTDPVWSERVSPVYWVGPKRYYGPLISLDELPHIDAVLISHDHYDHLDERTITAMKDWDCVFIVPLGVGAHLAYWGVAETKIKETDWWEITPVGPIDVITTPARHASGRALWDRDGTLWASYSLRGSKHRIFYSGDTGLFPGMRDIGDQLGPFDVTMIEVGQYDRTWPDWHIGPEQAVQAHHMLRGRFMLPIHWALFTLAYHGWTEPLERALVAAGDARLLTPKPGESIELGHLAKTAHWWPDVPWERADKNPVVSTKMGTTADVAAGSSPLAQ